MMPIIGLLVGALVGAVLGREFGVSVAGAIVGLIIGFVVRARQKSANAAARPTVGEPFIQRLTALDERLARIEAALERAGITVVETVPAAPVAPESVVPSDTDE